ncbi:sigma-70 family RNA polymerase sigma factor [Roseospira marina]|uniref:Sigma-70 family RNA polymerase sigma factor n=1 Tax=Roseospira marina TaxID=140057 RepID=A0A5M6IDZ0_9PROT|nr:sigma-70 family RNA polymerase sigma factor [Roseospira marina]KAA5606292.1 sigma-70 family RNA polymerase sigma factor [Roseospira marina]MBB4314450.1 RNA polymerase sigma-70 factor (ECF subfamily) [Roseospira marina]MBB5087610.1 RNA polymerase sigma-70 factor (ECF subfamily) [Roseospira marina]
MPRFEDLLVEALPHMRAFARSLTTDHALADDLVQEAATRALANRDSYEPGTNFRGWVFTILRNTFYSEQRRKWRKSETNDDVAMEAHADIGGQQAGLEMDDFKRAFARLPPEQREALILVGACGFEYEQAAAVIGCAPGTVKSRVSRARRDLRAMLDRDDVGSRRGTPPAGANDTMAEIERQISYAFKSSCPEPGETPPAETRRARAVAS